MPYTTGKIQDAYKRHGRTVHKLESTNEDFLDENLVQGGFGYRLAIRFGPVGGLPGVAQKIEVHKKDTGACVFDVVVMRSTVHKVRLVLTPSYTIELQATITNNDDYAMYYIATPTGLEPLATPTKQNEGVDDGL